MTKERKQPTRVPRIRLTDRDLGIMQAVANHRFLTHELLSWLFPPASGDPKSSHTHLHRRLKGLVGSKYLEAVRASDTRELAYGLTKAGADELVLRYDEAVDSKWSKKNPTIKQFHVQHVLMEARFRIAVDQAATEAPGVTVEHSERESARLKADWRHPEHGRFLVNPDAFVILRDEARGEDTQRIGLFLEAHNQMPVERLLNKYYSYAALHYTPRELERFNVPRFLVLTVAKTRHKASNILWAAADEIPVADRSLFLFTTEKTYTDAHCNVFAAIWRGAHDPGTLRGIIASPLPRQGPDLSAHT